VREMVASQTQISTREERNFAIVLYPSDPYSRVISVVRALPLEIVYKLIEGSDQDQDEAISRIFMIVRECTPYVCIAVRPPLERKFKHFKIPALVPASYEDLIKHALSEISSDGSLEIRYKEVPRMHIMHRIQQICEEFIVSRFKEQCTEIARIVTDMVLPPSHP